MTEFGTKEIVELFMFLVAICKIMYDGGWTGRTIKQHDNDLKKISASVVRLHERIDDMNCVKKPECAELSTRLETRIETSLTKICDLIEKMTSNQVNMNESIIKLAANKQDK